jgi:predicted CXXCH cytochrome family protein
MFRRFRGLAVLLCTVASLTAQDLDSVPSLQKRSPANLADQITEGAERSAFLQLFEHASAKEMQARAAAYIERFPQSAFLAQAYEVAARGCFDLGDYGRGLAYAQQSLALLPENPLLLVPVADVEARQHLNSAAITHAENALEDLDRFAGPSSVRDEDWPNVKQRLRATANFAKGRALLQQALAEPAGERRQALLKSSEASLTEALRFNGDDAEIAYMLGLAQLSSGDALAASSSFAAVYRNGGEFAPRVLDHLQAIHRLMNPGSTIPFETFVQQATDRWTASIQNWNKDSRKRSIEEKTSRSEPALTYFGSDSCRGCHAEIYTSWSESGMSKMFRPYAPQNVVGDFTEHNEFYLGDDADYRDGKFELKPGGSRALFARMVLREGRHYFDFLQSDGKWHSYPVDYTIGSKFEQAYATKLPNGEIHVFPIQYNLLYKQWLNFWKVIDGPGSERADPRTWERLDASTSYQAVCAACHTSQLRNTKGEGFAVNNVEFKEPGINCEMCHGPSGDHVLEMSEDGYHAKAPIEPPVNFHKIEARKSVAICAQCHMQSAVRNLGPGGELNYVSSGEFFGNRLRQPFGEFSRKGFYADGRFRQTTFMVEALERSQCFKKGSVSCTTCHDPHSHGSASNPTSLKFRDQPDLMCTGCHTQFNGPAAIARHSHHPAESEASRCVSCHMPRIMDALLFRARYHQIDDIPNPEMTKRFGQKESPNACLLCHKEKNADWVQERLSSWKQLRTDAR